MSTFLTLDGVMRAPGGPEEDDAGGFVHGWSVAEVLGDIFSASWPHASEEAGAKPLNDATKYVVSRSHPTLE